MMVLDANPVDLAGNMVVLSHPNRGTVKRFGNSDHAQTVAAAISATVGVELRVTMESADAVQAAGASDPASANQAGANPSARTSPDNPASANPSARKDQEQPADLAELEESVADSEDVQELDSIELLVDKLGAKPISSEEG